MNFFFFNINIISKTFLHMKNKHLGVPRASSTRTTQTTYLVEIQDVRHEQCTRRASCPIRKKIIYSPDKVLLSHFGVEK